MSIHRCAPGWSRFLMVLGALSLPPGAAPGAAGAISSGPAATRIAPPAATAESGAELVRPRGKVPGEWSWTGGRALVAQGRDARGVARDLADLGRPLAAALGHLDRDGVLDLAVSHAGGALVVYHGNEAFAAPAAKKEAWRAAGHPEPTAFLAAVEVVDLPFAADLLAVGDFDSDGDEDVAVGAVGRSEVLLLAGDGTAVFAPARRIALPGAVTAWAVGGLGARDEQADLAVGVETASGALLAIFEGREGALEASPELLPLPARASSMGIGRLGPLARLGRQESSPSIVVAAGAEVLVLSAPSPRIGSGERAWSEERVEAARFVLPGEIALVVLGDISGDELDREIVAATTGGELFEVNVALPEASDRVRRLGAANGPELLSTLHLSGMPYTDLLAATANVLALFGVEGGESLRPLADLALSAPAVAVLAARLDGDALDDLVVLGEGAAGPAVVARAPTATYTVNDAGDAADAVINNVCATAGGVCTLRAAIQEANAHSGSLIQVSNSVGFAPIQPATLLPLATGPVTLDGLQCSSQFVCWLTRLDGQSAPANTAGLNLLGSSATVSGFRITHFDGSGILLAGSGGHLIEGCEIGLVDGTTPAANGNGVRLSSSNNTVGGTTTASRNVISGNGPFGDGIVVQRPEASPLTGNTVLGNYIGTNSAGTAAVANGVGVSVHEGSTTIGTAVAGNLISGNGSYGINISLSAGDFAQVVVRHNRIGTNAAGTAALPNFHGVNLHSTMGTEIGGATTGEGNLISGNSHDGLYIDHGAANVNVRNNYIGTNLAGGGAVPNQEDGVFSATSWTGLAIGEAGAGNLISGNGAAGVHLYDSGGLVEANLIGTDANGTEALGNTGAGIRLHGAAGATIGSAAAPNLISGNGGAGVLLEPVAATRPFNNKVQGNRIGVTSDGVSALANQIGVHLVDGDGNQIGGLGKGNFIAFNREEGVRVDAGLRNIISSNSISGHAAGLGINLRPAGETAFTVSLNDPLDADTGPNGLQNFPSLASARVTATQIWVEGTLDSEPGKTYSIELFSTSQCGFSGFGEGQQFVGSVSATTNGSGHATFTFSTVASVPVGATITATATQAATGTSEFSACRNTTQQPSALYQDGFETGSLSTWSGVRN